MKSPLHGAGVPRRATAAAPKRFGTFTTPRSLGAQYCSPVQWLLLLILLCPLGEKVGAAIPSPGDPGPTNTLLNSWSFTDTTNWLSDHGYPPASFTNLGVSTLGASTALVVDSTEPAWLRFNVVESDGTTNLALAQGSVIFWFGPYWAGTNEGGTGPGVSSRLVEAGSYTEDASYGWWSLYVDPAGTNLYFSGQNNDGSQAVYLSAPIAWTTNRWHLIALTYSATNSALYIDGALATNGTPVTYMPGPEVLTNGFYVGSASNGVAQAHGMFDGLATYANPLDAGTVSSTFWYSYAHYYLNPMNSANWSSAPSYITNTPTFRAISGPGYLGYVGPSSTCVTNSNVWLANVTATAMTNATTTIEFSIMGGDTNQLYDVFGTGQLVGNYITNAQWVWLGQGFPCSRYTITNLPGYAAFLLLGSPQDTDQDGLPDALEILLTKTDPNNPDTDGDGIWDWFGPAYFGTSTVDPWASPMGDGWNNYEKFLYGLNAGSFCTPPTPRNFVVSLNQSNWTATLSWQPPSGVITGYTLSRWDYYAYEPVAFELGVTNRFVDSSFPPYTNSLDGPYRYVLVAHFLQGDSAAAVSAWLPAGELSIYTLAGPLGSTLMRATHVPPGATGLRLTMLYTDYSQDPWEIALTNFTFSLSSFTNGFFTLPQAWTTSVHDSIAYRAQAVWPDGSVGGAVGAGSPAPAFYDGRLQLAQNLAFVLRAADVTSPFYFQSAAFPDTYAFASPTSDLNGSCLGASYGADYTRPFEDNWLYRNFVFVGTNLAPWSGELLTGITWDDVNGDMISASPKYVFQMPTNGVFPGFLSAADTPWILPHNDPILLDLYTNAGLFTVQNNVFNWYGLRLLSAEFTSPGPFSITRIPGQSAGRTNSYFFANFEQPSLSTVGYIFGGYNWDGSYSWQGPLPGNPAFSPTNAQSPLVASLGNSYQAVAYARQRILNGDSTKPAYLGQYFESALQVNTNGLPTTNLAGALSPYGDFFPIQPGTSALVTMTNWGINERGTGIVYVVALATDANRDGMIDPSLFGPDYASPDYPFRFWVNDSQDSGDDGGNGIPGLPASRANGQDNHVNGTRDLVNFFPVSLEIRSLLQAYPANTFTCWLKNDQGTLNYADPDYIDLPIYATNCMAYLTDTNLAHSIAPTTLPPGAPTYNITPDGVMLSQGFIERIREGSGSVLLVEAKAATGSPLVLEIRQGTNVLAWPSLYLSISGVEQMFRQKNLIRETFPSTTELPGVADRLTTGNGYFNWDPTLAWNEPETNDKNFVFLHGYNVNPDYARGAFADVFKRLYWSGSHAKFYGVTWQGAESQVGGALTPNYHTNVVNAFLTAPKLANFLGTLTNGPTVVAAHSLGNMVALSSLSDWNARMDKYFMIDAAVPVEALQNTAGGSGSMFHPDWVTYANRLTASEWHSLFSAGDGRSALTWTNRLANLRSADVYNFYSSGEEVLRQHVGMPPDGILGTVAVELGYLAAQQPMGIYAWALQEKAKGRATFNGVLGSTHGGWGFNMNLPYFYFDSTNLMYVHMSNAQASGLPASQLQTNAFFNVSVDTPLFGASGSQYAQTNRNRILADAIPALSLPVGANPVPKLSPPLSPNERNFDMQLRYENGWPSGRPQLQVGVPAAGEWHHSDFRQVAYPFAYRLFDDFVSFGNLQ
jgi:hypothetical protein